MGNGPGASAVLHIFPCLKYRVVFNQCSSAEGERFVSQVSAFHGSIREMGSPGSAKRFSLPKLKDRLATAWIALAGEKLRWVVGKFKDAVPLTLMPEQHS
ncbi:MAG: hypothetical protein ABSF52_19445 [Syntrophobacteraceae bacterium]